MPHVAAPRSAQPPARASRHSDVLDAAAEPPRDAAACPAPQPAHASRSLRRNPYGALRHLMPRAIATRPAAELARAARCGSALGAATSSCLASQRRAGRGRKAASRRRGMPGAAASPRLTLPSLRSHPTNGTAGPYFASQPLTGPAAGPNRAPQPPVRALHRNHSLGARLALTPCPADPADAAPNCETPSSIASTHRFANTTASHATAYMRALPSRSLSSPPTIPRLRNRDFQRRNASQ